MATIFSDKRIVSIDVGTTKICVLIANQLDDEHVEIIGIGKAPSEGLKKGVVVDIAKTVNSIKAAVKEAELMAGCTVESAYIGISGGHIHSLNSHGMVAIKTGEIRQFDIASALAAAKATPIAEGQQLLHILPQYYVIDGTDRVTDPLGMHGVRLEVQAHIITGAVTSAQNLIKCCEMAGVKVNDIILEQLASADAVLSADERELGVGMLDIGGGTSDLALYQRGSIRHTMVLPVAGNHFTNDVAVGLRTTIKDAERIKKEYGVASRRYLGDDDFEIEIDTVQGTQKQIIKVSQLADILEPRATEVLSLVYEDIISHGLKSFIQAGFVLTGGGSLLYGMKDLAQEIFQVPVRIGIPNVHLGFNQSLENPMYATGYGLLVHAMKKNRCGIDDESGPSIKRIFVRMKSWISDFF